MRQNPNGQEEIEETDTTCKISEFMVAFVYSRQILSGLLLGNIRVPIHDSIVGVSFELEIPGGVLKVKLN